MNPIQKAISDIKFKIPMDILNAAFITREFSHRPIPVSLDTMIRSKVIEARVNVDCNLVGGLEVAIPLGGIQPEYLDPYTAVYRIPKALTQNRVISRVISLSIGNGSVLGTTNMGLQGYSQILDAAAGVFASQAAIPIVSTAYLSLIAENTVLVTDQMAMPNTVHLRCYLENDADMSQLRSTTYHKYAKLVELAVKSYIYNQLTISIGQAQLSGGMELGRFREIVDSFADAEENYQTYLEEVWRRVSIMDDQMSRERHLRMILGGQR